MRKFLDQAQKHLTKTALLDYSGEYTYGQLLAQSAYLAEILRQRAIVSTRVALLTKPGFDYVTAMWAIWATGNVGVPLCERHPDPSIQYVLDDAQCDLLLVDKFYGDRSSSFNINSWVIEHRIGVEAEIKINPGKDALILYTSGTTSKPKGVVIKHDNIQAQIDSLGSAWEWSNEDYIVNVLPLHHVHGIVNVVFSSLYHGATCCFLSNFQPERLFEVLLDQPVTLFMAVPTIYYQLIRHWDGLPPAEQAAISRRLNNLRLMVSGSAALPIPVLEQWREISGHTLLERYGMTEIGMALSNSYRDARHPGHVGRPLPGVEIKLMEAGLEVEKGQPGEIWVKGPGVFEHYWQRPEVTTSSFQGGWFKTGDMAIVTEQGYKILGRSSTDIIKSAGYKISALEIEDVLLRHPAIKACGVVGIDDSQWGEIICAAIVGAQPQDLEDIEKHVLEYLPAYKKPRSYFIMDELPRNVLGKITKPQLKELILQQLA